MNEQLDDLLDREHLKVASLRARLGAFGIDEVLPTHGGYHYSSTSVEWYHLIRAISSYQVGGIWNPQVSLVDGLRAVEIGLQATRKVVNEANNLDE